MEIVKINNLDHFVDKSKKVYPLGRKALDQETIAKRSKKKKFAAMFPIIPESNWVDINRDAIFGATYCLNQQSHGSCVGFSAAMSEMKSRTIRGQEFERLSGAYIYSWINGGVDGGAQITDALSELQNHGTCLESTVGWNSIYRWEIPSSADTEAQRFRISDGIIISTYEEMASAIQLGFIPQFAIEVGGNFENYDSEVVLGNFTDSRTVPSIDIIIRAGTPPAFVTYFENCPAAGLVISIDAHLFPFAVWLFQ